MELESQSGSKITLQNQTKLGRKSLSQTPDKTISRHHITLNPNTQKQETLNFVVYGKNPIFVLHEKDGEIKVYKRGDKGEMKVGDGFCVGFKDFFWFKVRGIGGDEDVKKMEELGVDFDEIGSAGGESESLDVSGSSDVVDPIQEFRFLVIGHEFDHYPKKKIRDIRNWDWFLEEHKQEDSDDEDDVTDTKPKKGKRRKRKKSAANDDEDDDVWTGESEEDAEVIKKLKNDPKPKYTTRSKDQKKSKKGASTSKIRKDMDVDVEDDEEDEDEGDETLGGFIVDDEDAGEEIDEVLDEETDEDDEEEEFEDEDDE